MTRDRKEKKILNFEPERAGRWFASFRRHAESPERHNERKYTKNEYLVQLKYAISHMNVNTMIK